MSSHRFINKMESSFDSGFRQVILYGQVEDIYWLEEKNKFINLNETLMWYFIEKNRPPQDGQIIVYFSRHHRDRIYAAHRPILAEDLMECPYPDGKWNKKNMKELSKKIVSNDADYPDDNAQS